MKTQPILSPRWTNTTKLVIGLTIVAIFAGLLIRFRTFIAPLLIAFIISYLLYPVADRLRNWLSLSWRLVVTLIYLLVIIILISLLTWGGLALAEQVLGLVRFFQRVVNQLPEYIEQVSTLTFYIGPFMMDFTELDLSSQSAQLFDAAQLLITRAGLLVGDFASSTASTVGTGMLILVISYFILSETEGIPGRMLSLNIPGYQYDIQRMGVELSRIWNAFFRGYLFLFIIAYIIYIILLGILGVRFNYLLALVSGTARMVPYVGPPFSWVVYWLVAFFQVGNPFGLPQFTYALLVIGISIVVDVVIDSVLTPRILGDALRVHPAAVLVAVLIAFNLLGIIGVLIAAPILATLQLFGTYAIRKLFDIDPWEGIGLTSSKTYLDRFDIVRQKISDWLRNRDALFRLLKKGKRNEENITNEEVSVKERMNNQ